MQPSTLDSRDRFANLDALRSIACLLVLSSHIIFEYALRQFPGSFLATHPLSMFFFGNGGLGVQIFFCLSGFLITHLLLQEYERTGGINVPNFYIRRILRIWPVYFTVVLFVFVVYAGGKAIATGQPSGMHESWVMSVLFLSNYDLIRILLDPNTYANGMLSLTWSVSVEEQFYLVWPLLLLAARPHRLRLILPLLILGSFGFALLYSSQPVIAYHHTFSNVLFLAAGGLIAHLRAGSQPFRNFVKGVSTTAWAVLAAMMLAALVWLKPVLLGTNNGLAVYLVLTALAVCALLAHQTIVPQGARLARFGFLVRMAKYTYGLYMYHRIAQFLLDKMFQKVWGVEESAWTGLLLAALTLALTALLSVASFRLMEAPLLSLKSRFEPPLRVART